jgi:hypothetical protein
MRNLIPIALLLIATSACTRSISVVLPPKTATVMGYADGKVTQRCAIRPDSEKFHKLRELLEQNSGGWHKRYTNYQPSIMVVDGDVSLYFMDGSVVLNYSGGEFSRGLSADAYQFLNCNTR